MVFISSFGPIDQLVGDTWHGYYFLVNFINLFILVPHKIPLEVNRFFLTHTYYFSLSLSFNAFLTFFLTRDPVFFLFFFILSMHFLALFCFITPKTMDSRQRIKCFIRNCLGHLPKDSETRAK